MSESSCEVCDLRWNPSPAREQCPRCERDRLQGEVERLRIYEPRLKRLEMGEGRADATVKVTPEFRENFALSMAAILAEQKAGNYVEMKVVSPDGPAFAVTVQRCEGQTPAEQKRAAESERDAAREALRACVDALARARHTSHNRMTFKDYWRLYARPAHDRAISALNGAPAKEESRER